MASTYGRVDPTALTARERDPVTGRRGPGREEQKERHARKVRAPRKALVIAAAAAAVVLVGAGALAVARGGDDETTVEAGAGSSTSPTGSGGTGGTPGTGTMITTPPDLTTMGVVGSPTKNTILWGGTQPDEPGREELEVPLYVDCAKQPCELGIYGGRIPLRGGSFSGSVELDSGCVGYSGGGGEVTTDLEATKSGDVVTHLTGSIHLVERVSKSPDGSGTCAGRDVEWDVDIPLE